MMNAQPSSHARIARALVAREGFDPVFGADEIHDFNGRERVDVRGTWVPLLCKTVIEHECRPLLRGRGPGVYSPRLRQVANANKLTFVFFR